MFNSINKDDISLSIRNGLYMPFMYKGRQIVVHNASWSFREKIWIDDELVVNRIGLSMASTHVVDVDGDAVEVTFGSRNGMKEIFLEVRVDGQLVHEVRHQAVKDIKLSTMVISLIAFGIAGAGLGYLVGYLVGTLFGGA